MKCPAIRDLIALVREELPYRGRSAERWLKLADEAAEELAAIEAAEAAKCVPDKG